MALGVGLSACSKDSEGKPREAREGQASAGADAPAPGERRVASRIVLGDELLWKLGPACRERVIGLSPMADDARYSLVAGLWPDSTPRLGRNPEELLAIAPDLVIVANFSDGEYREAIRDKVEVLTLENFGGFDDFRANLARVGAAVGAEAEAQKVRDEFDARVAAIEAKRPAGDRPSVVAWQSGYAPGPRTTFDDAAAAAGFVNGASEDGHQRVDTEQLVAWDPDWLVIGCGEVPCEEAVEALGDQAGIGQMRAVLSGQVIAVKAPALGAVGMGMLDLAEALQEGLLAGEQIPSEAP